jgi:hypothetical protein
MVPTSARKMGDPTLAPSPVDRRKMGSKHHLICDGRGTPLKVITTAANVNDVTQTRSRGVNRLVRSQQTKCHRSSTCLMRRQVDQHPLSIRPVRFLAVRLVGGFAAAWLAQKCAGGKPGCSSARSSFKTSSRRHVDVQCGTPLTCKKQAGSRLPGVPNAAYSVQVQDLEFWRLCRSGALWSGSGHQMVSIGLEGVPAC